MTIAKTRSGEWRNVRAAALVMAWVVAGIAPAGAQVDLEGGWAARQHEDAPERGGGPEVGEYQGCRSTMRRGLRGDSWSASLWTVPEHQCIPHPADYGPELLAGPHLEGRRSGHEGRGRLPHRHRLDEPGADDLDGRAAASPAHAPHTWQGFSTGRWEGDMLTVKTTHLKAGYLRRNGLARSEKATLREHFIRDGNVLTWITIVTDPVYLTEPYIKSRNFSYDPGYQMTLYPCSIDIEVRTAGGRDPALPARAPTRTSTSSRPSGRCRARRCAAAPRRCTRVHGEARSDDAAAQAGDACGGRRQAMMRALAATRARAARGACGECWSRNRAGVETCNRGRCATACTCSPGRARTRRVQVGRDGVLVVDPQTGAASASVLAAIRRLSDKPVRYIVNTTVDADHIGGNEAVAKSGQRLAGGNTRPATVTGTGGAPIFAHENLLNRLSASGATPATRCRPTPSSSSRRTCSSTARRCSCCTSPAAHTDGDTMVFFRRSDVISAGDVFTPDRYPVIDLARGGSIDGLIAGSTTSSSSRCPSSTKRAAR